MQVTWDELKEAILELERSDQRTAEIAVFYLKKELKRRKNSGRPSTSNLSRKEQIAEAVKRYRSKNKS